MTYNFNHVHLKAPDPGKTADWYVAAFDFEIIDDQNPRPQGDRFIRCKTKDGVTINISSARTGESMGDGDADTHWGIEHFGIEVDDIEKELSRLESLGAKILEGPIQTPGGLSLAFIEAPDDVRIEVMQLS